jgi:L-fucose isomerase-like protein
MNSAPTSSTLTPAASGHIPATAEHIPATADHIPAGARGVIGKKSVFGVIVSSRSFFNAEHARGARAGVLGHLESLGIEALTGSPELTPDGAVASRADALKYSALFRSRSADIDGIVVVLANFGDEIAVTETIKLSGLDVPVLVQACSDELDKLDVHGRRDAYCGKISVCSNLRQSGIAWTDTTDHVCPAASEEFRRDLESFARLCRTVKGIKTARVGAIGARPGAFRTVRYSEKLLQASGVTVVPVDLSEIFAAAESVADADPGLASVLGRISAYGRVPAGIAKSNILKQARFTLAVERWMDENDCDASAIQCWESMQKNYGCASCLSMSMMGEALRPSACEVDVTGAVSMYALTLASGRPAGFLDWNNNYGDREDLVVGTHCSNFPKGFMGDDIEISNLDILGESLGRERCFGAVKGKVAPGPFTYFRLSTDDVAGKIKCYGGEGEFTADPFPMDGGIAVCRIPGARALMRHVTREGFEHHVAMARGSWAAILEEAAIRYLGWSFRGQS